MRRKRGNRGRRGKVRKKGGNRGTRGKVRRKGGNRGIRCEARRGIEGRRTTAGKEAEKGVGDTKTKKACTWCKLERWKGRGPRDGGCKRKLKREVGEGGVSFTCATYSVLSESCILSGSCV